MRANVHPISMRGSEGPRPRGEGPRTPWYGALFALLPFLFFAVGVGGQETEPDTTPAADTTAQAAPAGDAEGPPEEEVAEYVEAYRVVTEIREAYQDRFGQTHNSEALVEVREEMREEIAEALGSLGMTPEEYDEKTVLVSGDAGWRARFDALLSEAEGEGETRVAAAEGDAPAEESDPGNGEGRGDDAPQPEEDRAVAPGEEPGDPPPDPTPEMVAAGEEVFQGAGACLSCHGEGGTGSAIGPDLTDDAWLHADGSYGSILDVIMNGVSDPKESQVPMLPRGGTQISDEQVRAVAAYVWSLSRDP